MSVAEESHALVLLEAEDGVTTVTLNRPERHNSLVPELLEPLAAAFSDVGARKDAAVAVLKAAGPSFSTGGDLGALREHRADIENYADRLVGSLNRAIVSILECDLPVIAAVDGQVTGGALGLVLACDIVVVTERASFTPYYVDVGFSPDGGWTALLPEVIGRSRAAGVQLLNDTIDAQRALEWGLAYAMVPSRELEDTVARLCAGLTEKKAGSLRATKRLLRSGRCRERLNAERTAFVCQIQTPDALDGMEDFPRR